MSPRTLYDPIEQREDDEHLLATSPFEDDERDDVEHHFKRAPPLYSKRPIQANSTPTSLCIGFALASLANILLLAFYTLTVGTGFLSSALYAHSGIGGRSIIRPAGDAWTSAMLDGVLRWPSWHYSIEDVEKELAAQTPSPWQEVTPLGQARVSRLRKQAVYGDTPLYTITPEDSMVLLFDPPPVNSSSHSRCALTWHSPGTAHSDLTAKGDTSEVEVWALLASAPASNALAAVPAAPRQLLDRLSHVTLPPHTELLGTLDIGSTLTRKSKHRKAYTSDFCCPQTSLAVELRCQRVGCRIGFVRDDDALPHVGFALAYRDAAPSSSSFC